MSYYPAIISKNEIGLPENYSLDDYVKVRIPAFHGCSAATAERMSNSSGQSVTVNASMCLDDDLPWAILSRSLENREFSATALNENDIVYVSLENNDATSPIIVGFASRFPYTEDPLVAQYNLINGYSSSTYGGNYADGSCGFEEFGGANAIVQKALSQVGEKESPANSNKQKYGAAYGRNGIAWCCQFVWWVFNNTMKPGTNETYKDYFYGGKKTAYCPDLVDYYKKKNQFITSGFKAGDIIFFDWNNNGSADHVGIVATDTTDNTSKVDCVEGNTSNGSGTDRVCRKQRSRTYILGAARLGIPKSDSIATGTNKEQVYKYLTRGLAFGSNGEPFNSAVACGILANIEKESSFNPNCTGDNGTSYGLCQWHDTSTGKGRMTNLKNFCKENGYDYTSITGQMFFLQKELNSSYASMVNSLLKLSNNVSGARTAAEIWCKKFEVPANADSSAKKRANIAENTYWPQFGE